MDFKARELFMAAASQGLRDAQYQMACLYRSGDGVEKDLNKARELARLAAAQGGNRSLKLLSELELELSSAK